MCTNTNTLTDVVIRTNTTDKIALLLAQKIVDNNLINTKQKKKIVTMPFVSCIYISFTPTFYKKTETNRMLMYVYLYKTVNVKNHLIMELPLKRQEKDPLLNTFAKTLTRITMKTLNDVYK